MASEAAYKNGYNNALKQVKEIINNNDPKEAIEKIKEMIDLCGEEDNGKRN